jgi:hypothetical protein
MKRAQFIRELRQLAKEQAKAFEIFENKGKGRITASSATGRMTTRKSGELTPSYMRLIRKPLDL